MREQNILVSESKACEGLRWGPEQQESPLFFSPKSECDIERQEGDRPCLLRKWFAFLEEIII